MTHFLHTWLRIWISNEPGGRGNQLNFIAVPRIRENELFNHKILPLVGGNLLVLHWWWARRNLWKRPQPPRPPWPCWLRWEFWRSVPRSHFGRMGIQWGPKKVGWGGPLQYENYTPCQKMHKHVETHFYKWPANSINLQAYNIFGPTLTSDGVPICMNFCNSSKDTLKCLKICNRYAYSKVSYNLTASKWKTPFHMACKEGQFYVVELMFDN